MFCSQRDENLKNPALEAIGYSIDTTNTSKDYETPRPLEKGIIETKNETDVTIRQSLTQKVFTSLERITTMSTGSDAM